MGDPKGTLQFFAVAKRRITPCETCDTLRRGYPMTPSAMRSNAASAVPDSAPAEKFTSAEIQAQLKRLVESPFFRSSKRCRLFLERVVEHSLSQSPEPLKERTLGVHVFAREPTYDTATDPIVRVTAGDVRRRLGQYYAEEAHHLDLRIDLPP